MALERFVEMAVDWAIETIEDRDRMNRLVSSRPLNASSNVRPRLSITPPPTDENTKNRHEAFRTSEARPPFPLRLYHRLMARLRRFPFSNSQRRSTIIQPRTIRKVQTSQGSLAQSPFLRLPGELRNEIYQYLLADDTFHIAMNERTKKLAHVKCTWWSAPTYKSCIFKESRGHRDIYPFFVRMCLDGKMNDAGMWNSVERTNGDVMSLLRTCKTIYSDCVDFVYAQNTFSFSDLYTFLVFSGNTLPTRFSCIQHLHIAQTYKWDYTHALMLKQECTTCLGTGAHSVEENCKPRDEDTWQTIWEIIAQMPNLKSLDVLLHWDKAHRHRRQHIELLELRFFAPMTKLRVDKFDVRVNWPGPTDSSRWPFRVIRDLTRFDYLAGGSRFVRAN